jgi:hypothetical protein
MRLVKGITCFLFLLVSLGSCFDPPEFSNRPTIIFNDIKYYQGVNFGADSIVLAIDFTDGDGDLGLTSSDPPYHRISFFQGKDGDTVRVLSRQPRLTSGESITCLPPVLDFNNSFGGKLVTQKMRQEDTDYDFLPSTAYPSNCVHYFKQAFIINESERSFFSSEAIIDSIQATEPIDEIGNSEITYTCSGQLISSEKLYLVYDTFFGILNPNHNNITVEFFVKNNDGTYPDKPYDWISAFPPSCGVTYDGRFPIVSDDKNAVEGTLKYSLKGFGFLQLFSLKTLKLRVTIKDRALNNSNVLETPEFTLSQIKAN